MQAFMHERAAKLSAHSLTVFEAITAHLVPDAYMLDVRTQAYKAEKLNMESEQNLQPRVVPLPPVNPRELHPISPTC